MRRPSIETTRSSLNALTILVLDLDGVVITGHPDGGRWDKDVARDFGMDPAVVQERFFGAHWHRIEIGEADLHTVLAEVWPSLGAERGDPASFVHYWFANDSCVDREVLMIVDGWRQGGRAAFLGTVQEHHRAKYVWNDLGLRRHFDGMLYSADLGAKKPQAAFYERAAARLGVRSAEDILFLDDRTENVAAARAAGWRAYRYARPDDLKKALTTA